MSIKVNNQSDQDIRVSINHWGKGGDTTYFAISGDGGHESWDRSDPRGFVMAVQRNGGRTPLLCYCQQ